jgi:hypothetical protein
MSQRARAVADDVIESVREDDLEGIIAQVRKEGEVEDEPERLALK